MRSFCIHHPARHDAFSNNKRDQHLRISCWQFPSCIYKSPSLAAFWRKGSCWCFSIKTSACLEHPHSCTVVLYSIMIDLNSLSVFGLPLDRLSVALTCHRRRRRHSTCLLTKYTHLEITFTRFACLELPIPTQLKRYVSTQCNHPCSSWLLIWLSRMNSNIGG